MNINEILEIFKKGANTPRDNSSEYQKGRSDGKSQAYAHAWTELKNLNIPDVSNCGAKWHNESIKRFGSCDICKGTKKN